jgi:hypothetical protein
MHRTNALIVSFVSLGLLGGCTWSPDANINGGGQAGGAGRNDNGGVGGTGVGFDGGPGPTADANCGVTNHQGNRLPPDLLLVFDRSGSMLQDPMTGNNCGNNVPAAMCPSKWNQSRTAVNMAVAASQATIRWGLKLFSSGGGNNNTCGVAAGAEVPIAINNAMAIQTALTNATAAGSTPTTLAVTNGGNYLSTLTTPNPRFLVLVTDGEPNCGAGGGQNSDATAAIAAVATQAARGYGTFVIGINNIAGAAGNAAATTLTGMSTAGLHPRAGTPNYYVVTDTAELVTALGAISTQVASCTFTLAMPPPDPSNVVVLGDGKMVPKDMVQTDSGWTYGTGMTEVTLTGTYCQDVMNGVIQNVEVLFGCNNITPTIP